MRPLLFNEYAVALVMRGRQGAVRQRIHALTPDRFLDEGGQQLIPSLMEEFQLDVPLLKRVARQSDTEVIVPFEGDAALFHVLPEAFDSVPPRAEVGASELVIAKHDFEQTLLEINRYLESLSYTAKRFNETLTDIVATELKKRKKQLGLM
jgi:hypothetical protein